MQITSVTMEEWISSHAKSGALAMENSVVLDVGAYHGAFTKQILLQNIGLDKAILFEANPENYQTLESSFTKNSQVMLVNEAVGKENGEIDFFCDNDLATGSILPYQGNAENIKKQRVKLTRIDSYLQNNPISERISLIKTDTQGNDLDVLKGAEKTIEREQPWLVIELIFIPLYQNQGSPEAIFSWLAAHNYTLASLFNMHYSADGWLAFADGVFVPKHVMEAFKTPFYLHYSYADLIDENAMLRQTCEERLQLINRLHEEAQNLRLKKKKSLFPGIRQAFSRAKSSSLF